MVSGRKSDRVRTQYQIARTKLKSTLLIVEGSCERYLLKNQKAPTIFGWTTQSNMTSANIYFQWLRNFCEHNWAGRAPHRRRSKQIFFYRTVHNPFLTLAQINNVDHTKKLNKNKEMGQNEPKLVFILTDEKRWNSGKDHEKIHTNLSLIENEEKWRNKKV